MPQDDQFNALKRYKAKLVKLLYSGWKKLCLTTVRKTG